MLTTAIPDNGM